MKYLDEDNKSYFIQEHPCIKGSIITLFILIVFFSGIKISQWMQSEQANTPISIPVEIRKTGELIVAKSKGHESDEAKTDASIGKIPLWYKNQIDITCYGESYVIYDLDKTTAQANTLTKTVTVSAPKYKIKTHLDLDTYDEKEVKQTIFNPVTGSEINEAENRIEKKLNDLAKDSELPASGKKSFEKRMTKWITSQDAYKDYKVKFKYAS